MEDVKIRAKQLILSSPAGKMVTEERIEEIFSNIVMFETKEELMDEYSKYNGPMKYISAFTNSDKIYMGPEKNQDKLTHNIVHEVLHRMSKKWDENGQLIQNGMQCTKGQRFSNFVNEGITDYLTKRIVGGNYCQYHGEVNVIEGLDQEMVRYFDNPDILFSMYLQDDNTGLENKRFQEFLETTKGKGAHEDLYENISFMNKEKTDEYIAKVHKGVNRTLRKRKLRQTLGKIKSFLGMKEKTKMLADEQSVQSTSKQEMSLAETLHGQVSETYEESPPRNLEGIEEQQ